MRGLPPSQAPILVASPALIAAAITIGGESGGGM